MRESKRDIWWMVVRKTWAERAVFVEVYLRTSNQTPICLSVWKLLLFVCPNVINQFKDAQRAKAEQSRPAREGRREAAAFTVSHESLQPTVLDLCHAPSLLLSFFPSHSVFLTVPGQAHWGAQPTSLLHMAPPPKNRKYCVDGQRHSTQSRKMMMRGRRRR